METIRNRIINALHHVKKHASGMYEKIQEKGSHIAKGSSKTIILLQKAIEFENHMNNDIRFQEQCENLAYILYEDIMSKNDGVITMNALQSMGTMGSMGSMGSMNAMNAMNETETYRNMEKILMNAITIYTTLYFMDRTLFMSKKFMTFMIKYPVSLKTEDDVLNYLDMYEEFCTK